jgi:hypothetical protein
MHRGVLSIIGVWMCSKPVAYLRPSLLQHISHPSYFGGAKLIGRWVGFWHSEEGTFDEIVEGRIGDNIAVIVIVSSASSNGAAYQVGHCNHQRQEQVLKGLLSFAFCFLLYFLLRLSRLQCRFLAN